MQFELSATDTAVEELSRADYPEIRFFTVGRNSSLSLASNVEGQWRHCIPRNAGSMSAVAYYFARKLHNNLEVPVGVIVSAWGGTNAEEWTAEEYLKGVAEFHPILDRWEAARPQLEDLYLEPRALELEIDDICFFRESGDDLLLDDFEDHELRTALFGEWTAASQEAISGLLQIESGFLHFADQSRVGSNPVLRVRFAPGRTIDLSQYDGIRFKARGKGCLKYHSIQPTIIDWDNYSLALIGLSSEWKSITIRFDELRQAGWGKQLPLTPDQLTGALFELHSTDHPLLRPPSGLYRGMIHPLIPFGLRGVIWYQGEGNAARAFQYRKLLPAMIRSWREGWQSNFPFLIVQLPNFRNRKPSPSESDWAELREAQLMTAETLPETGLVVTIDLGEADDVHPKDKSLVGNRLALLALGRVYGEGRSQMGPTVREIAFEGRSVRIAFNPNGGGLIGAGSQLSGFALAGEDHRFYWADSRIEGDSVVLRSESVSKPIAVRYAWADNPECSLYNTEGHPASPFRSDDWPGITFQAR
jgi:sialate O-acetylesterase